MVTTGFSLCLGITEAAILARAAAEQAAAMQSLAANTAPNGPVVIERKPPPLLGVFALRPKAGDAALLGTAAMHKRLTLLRDQPRSANHKEYYDRINAIATDLRVGMALSAEDRMNLLASLIHDEDFPFSMLPYLVDVYCDLAGTLSDSHLKMSVKEASRSFNLFLWDNDDLTNEDWVIFANETVRLFYGTTFLYQILAQLYSQRLSVDTDESALDSIRSLPHMGVGVAGEITTAALARYPFSDPDFARALELITNPVTNRHSTKENALHQIGVIANSNHELTVAQLKMLEKTVIGLLAEGADPILSGWTLARIAGHRHYPEIERLKTLFSLTRTINWPVQAIDEFILTVVYITRHDSKLRSIPWDLVSELGNQGIHIGNIDPATDRPKYRVDRHTTLSTWGKIWEFFRDHYRENYGGGDLMSELERNVA